MRCVDAGAELERQWLGDDEAEERRGTRWMQAWWQKEDCSVPRVTRWPCHATLHCSTRTLITQLSQATPTSLTRALMITNSAWSCSAKGVCREISGRQTEGWERGPSASIGMLHFLQTHPQLLKALAAGCKIIISSDCSKAKMTVLRGIQLESLSC